MIDAARWLAQRHLLTVWRQPTGIHLLSLPDFLGATTAAIENPMAHGIHNLGDDRPVTLQSQHRGNLHLLPLAARAPQTPQEHQPAGAAQRGTQTAHARDRHLPARGQLPATGAGVGSGATRRMAGRRALPGHGAAARTTKGGADVGGLNRARNFPSPLGGRESQQQPQPGEHHLNPIAEPDRHNFGGRVVLRSGGPRQSENPNKSARSPSWPISPFLLAIFACDLGLLKWQATSVLGAVADLLAELIRHRQLLDGNRRSHRVTPEAGCPGDSTR